MSYMKTKSAKLQLYKGNVECPRCEGSGLIYKTLLWPLNKEVFVCDECDATWLSPEEIESGFFQDFTSYVCSEGYTYDEVDLKNIDYEWYERDYMGKKKTDE